MTLKKYLNEREGVIVRYAFPLNDDGTQNSTLYFSVTKCYHLAPKGGDKVNLRWQYIDEISLSWRLELGSR